MTFIQNQNNSASIEKHKQMIMRNSRSAVNTSASNTMPNSSSDVKLKSQLNSDKLVADSPKKRKDPLMTYPGRALAYSNEFGVALSPISKGLGLALWVPALMYFGADIYDKYQRGENDDYSHSSGRKGVQQAIFQGLASCLLPILAVDGGQHVASHLMKKGKAKMSADSQIEVLHAIDDKITERKISQNTTQEEAEEQVLKPIMNLFDKDIKKMKKKERKKLSNLFGINIKATPKMDRGNTENFIKNNITEVLDLREKLLNGNAPKKLQKHYKELSAKFSHEDDGAEKALRKTMKKFINNKSLRPTTMKTIGGFIGLFTLAVPIDYLVENVIIKRAVEPGLETIEHKAHEDPNFLGGMFFKGDKNKVLAGISTKQNNKA